MHLYELIKKLSKNKKIIVYIDMDGVIASYDVGKLFDIENKRPLYTNIKTLSKWTELKNAELRILSVCRFDSQITEKNAWLEQYAPFFEKSKRNIISKQSNSSIILTLHYLKSLQVDEQIVLVDNENEIFKTIHG